jgi:hypothetical protein
MDSRLIKEADAFDNMSTEHAAWKTGLKRGFGLWRRLTW